MEAIATRYSLLPRSLPVSGTRKAEIAAAAAAIPFPLPSAPASSSLRDFSFPSKNPKSPRLPCSSSNLQESKPSTDLGLLLEVEGVLADIHRFGNRQSFNVAFQKLGLDCANWTEPVYADLMRIIQIIFSRKAGGDEDRMLVLFFNRIGWPTSLPTSEKESFMKNVIREKRKALEEIVTSSNLPLRPGVENFIDDALSEGVPVMMLIAYSRNGDKISRSIIDKLGHDRISKIKIIGKEEVEGSFYGQLVLGKGVSSTLDEQLVKEAQKAVSMEKQRIAEEVAAILKLTVDIDTSPSENFEKIVATLRAGAEYAGLPAQNCVLIAGSQSSILGAERVGMPCVVLRSSLTARAEFRQAKAVMDGFGGADLTISRLRHKKWS
ncbi:CBBY-like protein isoform X3 [Phoenix dactylifera]|uniref:CBBY-like protein isoform X3 n=1 Tax=Phoenix dactylifera TaxID=42345 RepID=A0A8B8JB48_PHODC|nr:CBBY-like protein isoform X3 [Phoenix dactylifera]